MRDSSSAGLISSLAAVLCAAGCTPMNSFLRGPLPPVYAKVAETIDAGKQVSVAVLCEARTTISQEHLKVLGLDEREWPKSVCIETQGTVERELFAAFGGDRRFRIVDRAKAQRVLEEQKLSVSGVVSSETQLKIGQMLGATHLLMIDETLHGSRNLLDSFNEGLSGEKPYATKEIRTQRLIDAETGTVLATDRREY